MQFLDTSQIRLHLDQRIYASDGTQLSVDLYLPREVGRYPVLLTRVPTDNNRALPRQPSSRKEERSVADRWKALATQGFIVAAADVRGRGDSDGSFHPFASEGSDGAATVAWLRTLPECNGKIGLFGTGYAAFCAWAALAANADVDAIASVSPFGAVGEGLCHQGGVVRLDWLFWMHLVGGRALQPAALPNWSEINRHLPLISMDTALGRSDLAWKAWLQHLDPADAFWSPLAVANRLANRAVAALHITGWWDAQLSGARYFYEAAKSSGGPQSLIIGAWDTAAVRHPTSEVGGLDFGMRSLIDLEETVARFFSAQLRGESNGFSKPSARLFVTGRNEWIEHEGWPVTERETRRLYLSSQGAANTRRGNGVLVDDIPSRASTDEISHNPTMPVDFQPNFTSFAADAFSLTLDQGHITARDEALVYTSPPLTGCLSVLGRPTVKLTVWTSAPDADLYILLSDAFPLELRDLHLSHTAVRVATVPGFRTCEPCTITLKLAEVAHDFLPRHSIRLTVTPSLFPLYARNPHQLSYTEASTTSIARIELRHGGSNGGSLDLPVAASTKNLRL